MRFLPHTVFAIALFAALPLAAAEPQAQLRLQPGDHVAYVGNTLADRMQHVCWLETLIQSRYPKHQLVFRNLGFSADEIDNRPRTQGFGSPDEWLTKVEADVIFAFFGYNESFAGEAGLKGWRDKLTKFIDDTRGKKYNGKSAPRIVLFSPIAHENLHNPHLPDGSENNARLKLYTDAMAEVAQEKGVVFVDLFSPTQQLYAQAKQPLTINGIHLNPEGNRQLAEVIDAALFGKRKIDWAGLEKLRQVVIDKSFHWWNMYQVPDGYNVYGGRSKLNWHGQSNADVMQREMQVFNVMTQNRDKRIWAVAGGSDLTVDDSNTPPLLSVKTNKPGPLEGGQYPFLGGEEAIGKMKIAEGMQINLFASEEIFPDLVNPVQMSVGPDSRLWVATWPSYPHWNPKKPLSDKIVILPDENGDGKADKLIVFADGLNSVTGFEFWGGGILVAAAPDILFLKDTDGDDKADVKIRMIQGISSADTHHTANSLVVGPDGGLYMSHGVFHVDAMETPTKTFRSKQTGVYRFDPRTFEYDFHFPIGPNPHGDVFDQWGYQFASDGTSGTGSYVSIGKGVKAPKQWYKKRVRPVPATGILSSSHFPPENNGNFLICNAIGFLGVLQHRVEYDGADINAVEIEPIVVSSDPNFRPTDLEIGGDGGLYISDWCNPLIGHMQHNMRDPNRDHSHGRVYRVTYKGRPLLKPVKMKGKPIADVLENFYAKENGTRYRARLELSGRKTADVTAAIKKWAAGIQPNTPENEQALLECLWVFQEHRVPNEALLTKVYQAKEPRVRAAAIRVLGAWGPQIKSWESLLLSAAREDEPLVRAEAAKAAVSFQGLAAAEAVFEVAARPTDVQLDFVLRYAQGKINVDKVVQDALNSGRKLSLAAEQYVLRNASIDDLLKLEASEAVYRTILTRQNVPAPRLRDALAGLAKLRKQSQFKLLLELIAELDAAKQGSSLSGVSDLLLDQPPAELQTVKARLKQLATKGNEAETRRLGYAGWITAVGSADDAMLFASDSKDALRDLLESVPLVSNEDALRGMFPKIRSLMFELPAGLKADAGNASLAKPGILVEYFEPNPKNAKLESFERLKPRAAGIVPEIKMDVPQLKRRDGFALRFTGVVRIDKSGEYTFFTNSDDGSRLYIDGKPVVNNDGLHGMQEKRGSVKLTPGWHPIVVTYFDNGGGDGLDVRWRGPGIRKKSRIPSDRLSAAAADTLHDLAIRSLKHIPGYDAEKFQALFTLIKANQYRTSAIRALQEIPQQHWPEKLVRPLVDNLVGYASSIPAKLRTGEEAQDAIKLARSAANRLPEKQKLDALNRLQNLDVRVIAIGTVPHRMIYDKEQIAIQAGKPVEFRFSNTDSMPHNFSITLPGAMEEIGTLAEATARDPDAMERQYIPKSDKILLASRLLQPGETQALSFEAPQQPGIYPYVCTYPGHWRRMYGALYVVADVEAYEADPAAYVAEHKLQIRDELLKYSTRGREWKLAELVDGVKPLADGRNYEVGKQVFKVASCISCHRLNNEGHQFGPDLAKLDPEKKGPEHILRSILEPSHQIEEKYYSNTFALDSGMIVTGMVVEETADVVKVIQNPLAKAEPLVIPKNTIEERVKAKKSIMPEGLANKLSREEILDLIAYVFARGDKKHALFKKHEHHH